MFRLDSGKCFYETNPIPPYTNVEDRERLLYHYQSAHSRLSVSSASMSCQCLDTETVFLQVNT